MNRLMLALSKQDLQGIFAPFPSVIALLNYTKYAPKEIEQKKKNKQTNKVLL